MEKFMLIFQGGMPSDLSPEQMQANRGKWMDWIDKKGWRSTIFIMLQPAKYM